jgi:hypothetical protein
MMPNAANLSPDDMADLGAYFDSQTNTGLEADPSYWQAGEKLYRAATRRAAFPPAWPATAHRPWQRAGEISGAARPTVGVCGQAAE